MAGSDGRYVFRRCMPDGDVTVANVAPGELLEREFSFRVNAPIEMQEALDSGEVDPRNILHGADGELYDGEGNFLATVNTWEASVSPTVADYQAATNMIEWGITTGYQVSLTFTETVVQDNMFSVILEGLQTGRSMQELNFTGVLRSHTAGRE